MPSAPAFELGCQLSRAEQALRAFICAACAASVAAWLCSHVDASAAVGEHLDRVEWLAVVAGAAGAGGALAWALTRRPRSQLAWREGVWTLQRGAEPPQPGTLRAMLDAGSWLLLYFRPVGPGRACWLSAGRRAAGNAWHPLRATLFAPSSTVESTVASAESTRP
jgi:hypothetical protein